MGQGKVLARKHEIKRGAAGCIAGAKIVSNLLQLYVCRINTSHCIWPLRAVCVLCHGRENIFDFPAVATLQYSEHFNGCTQCN